MLFIEFFDKEPCGVSPHPLNSHLFSLPAHESKIIIPFFLLFLFFISLLGKNINHYAKPHIRKPVHRKLGDLNDQQVNMKIIG